MLEDKDWQLLLSRIRNEKCTPFIGAGACHGTLPLGAEIAKEWAGRFNYPMKDCEDLVKVAQFLAVENDYMFPKEELLSMFKNIKPPDFNTPDEPHGILSDLPFPIYITTNYDDFMVQALKGRNKDPKREFCRWNNAGKGKVSLFDSYFKPTAANPLVFHLHGYNELAESLVLSEDDYLSFLVNLSRDQEILPPVIQGALSGTSLIFIGYKLADWDFRVLFQGILSTLDKTQQRISVTVQLPPGQDDIKVYQEKYFGEMAKGMKVFWGTAREFTAELKKRWEQFK